MKYGERYELLKSIPKDYCDGYNPEDYYKIEYEYNEWASLKGIKSAKSIKFSQIQVINATPQKRCLAYKKSPEKKRGKRLPSLWGG